MTHIISGQGTHNIKLPFLQPIPIRTKNECLPIKGLIWVFSVRNGVGAEGWTHTLSGGKEIRIIKGFEFDCASITRQLWIVLSPIDLTLILGFIHDYSYKQQHLGLISPTEGQTRFGEHKGRLFWDWVVLKEGIRANGYTIIDIRTWVAFGWVAWSRHKRND